MKLLQSLNHIEGYRFVEIVACERSAELSNGRVYELTGVVQIIVKNYS